MSLRPINTKSLTLDNKNQGNSSEVTFSPSVPLTNKDITDMWSLFPYAIKKAINKERKTPSVTPVTEEELLKKRDHFLNGLSSENK